MTDSDQPGPDEDASGAGREPIAALPRGFRGRTLVTAKLATRAGFGMLRKTLRPGARKRAGSADPSADEARAVEAAEKLVAQLDGLKGVLMKFGQMASYLDGALPPAARQVLARLQDESTPMAPDAIAAIVRGELGADPSDCFERFEPTPFAAASIGQVHRATLDGREVAVKVQYPGVEDSLRSDLRTLSAFARVASIGSRIDGAALAAELAERVLQECDYEQEAASQRLFARLWADDPGVIVPRVYESRTTRRVLTTELSPGAKFASFRDGATQADRDRAGEAIFRVCFASLFTHCVFNADPHPGNYLFPGGHAVVFLDFGCVRRFPAVFIERWKHFARTVIAGDRRGFPDAFRALGMLARERKFDWDYQWEVFQYLYEPFLTRGRYTYRPDHVARSFEVLMWANPNKYKLAMPREWLFLNRLQWGLQSVLADLGATADWRAIITDILDAPTTPAA